MASREHRASVQPALCEQLEPRRLLSIDSTGSDSSPVLTSSLATPLQLFAANDRLFYTQSSPGDGLWSMDGAGNRLQVAAFYKPTSPDAQAEYSGSFFFHATSGSLMRSDAYRSANVPFARTVSAQLAVSGQYLFVATNGCQLWRTDGTSEGSLLLHESSKKLGGPRAMTDINGKLHFVVYSNPQEQHLATIYETDGTPEGTRALRTLATSGGAAEYELLPAGGEILLAVKPREGSGFLYRVSDGKLVAMLSRNADGHFQLCVAGGKVYLLADDALQRPTFYVSGGARATTHKITATGGDVDGLVALHDRVYFVKDAQVWRSDGTDAGTLPVTQRWVQRHTVGGKSTWTDAPPVRMTSAGGMLYFFAYDRGGDEYLMRLRPSDSSYRIVGKTNGTHADSSPARSAEIVQAGSSLYVLLRSRLYQWDGDSFTTTSVIPSTTELTEAVTIGIAAAVFNDANRNGQRDEGEEWMPGVRVFIDLNGSGIWNKDEPWFRSSEGGFDDNFGYPRIEFSTRSRVLRIRMTQLGDGWEMTRPDIYDVFVDHTSSWSEAGPFYLVFGIARDS